MGGGSSTVTTSKKETGLDVTTSVFGNPIPIVFGTQKLSGNIIDYIDFTAIEHSQSSGGKGGGGVTTKSYTYKVAVDVGLCEGETNGIARVWDGSTAYKKHALNGNLPIDSATLSKINSLYYDSNGNGLSSESSLSVYYGSQSQQPWSYMQSKHPERALSYPYLCHVAGYIDLGESNSVPSYAFEILGRNIYGNGILDCEPYWIVKGLLYDPVFGVNYPSEYIGDLDLWRSYCLAMGIFLSVGLDSQTGISDVFNDLMTATNSQFVNSQGSLKVVPYGTTAISGNGATYEPDLDAVYSLTDQDFIYEEGEDPVQMSRDESSDIFNFQQVTFKNRSDEYASDVVSAEDPASINQVGLKKNDSTSLDCICTEEVALIAVSHILERSIYHRNQYTLKLPYFPFFMLDPMDLVQVTDEGLGLNKELMRVNTVEIDSDKYVSLTVEEVGITGTGQVEYSRQSPIRTASNAGVSSGSVNAPVIFEPPAELGDGYSVWIGVSGKSKDWGGCFIWLSNDGDSFSLAGQIQSRARQGILSSALLEGSSTDESNVLSVDLSQSLGELSGGTKTDADNYNTLCYVDGELISYENADLTATNKYNLSSLRRGVYGTEITKHKENSQFLRIDKDKMYTHSFTEADIGKTVYIKFTSYNIYGAKEEDLADVSTYQYTIKGSATYSSLKPITNLSMNYVNKKAVLTWDALEDFRSPIFYEIRMGETFKNAVILGKVSVTSFTCPSNGTYWVAAVYQTVFNGTLYTAYSSKWENIDIELSSIPANIIATYDEQAEGWQGILSSGVVRNLGSICLGGKGKFSEITKVSEITNFTWLGGVATAGTYTIPEDHIVSIASCQQCTITCTYLAKVVSAITKVSQYQKVSEIQSFSGEDPSKGSISVQINVMGANDEWQGWSDFSPGEYYGKKFNFRLVLATTDKQFTVYVQKFAFSVDVPDKSESKNIVVPVDGITVTYDTAFNMIPKPVISVVDKQEGDTEKLTKMTSTGFTIKITNNGTAVSRNINYAALGW